MQRRFVFGGGVLTVLVIGCAWLLAGALTAKTPAVSVEELAQEAGTDDGTALSPPATPPEFPQKAEWLQSKPLSLADLRGKVVVVHFWTFGCINCIHNYPVYKSWLEKYADKGVTIIGVHTPEFAHEANVDKVRAKARDNGLKFPIVIDNDSGIWKSWNNGYWPSIYLIDKKGKVRYHWDGELHLDTKAGKRFAARIDELVGE